MHNYFGIDIDNFPNSWNDITIEEWADLNLLKKEDIGPFSFELQRFCILAGVEIDDDRIQDVDIDDISTVIKSLNFLNSIPSANINRKLNVDNKEYHLINFDDITLGEFIDLDAYITNEYFNNFTKIISILYKKTKINEWGEVEYEPYEFNINKRCEDFNYVYITDVYAAVEELMKYRQNILEVYSIIFNGDDGGELTEEEKEGLTEEDIIEINSDLEKEKKRSVFAWPSLIYNLANEDITKMKDVLGLKLTFVLNMMVIKIIENQK